MKINIDAAARLKLLREKAGYESAQAFADKYEIPDGTYRAHENASRNISIGAAKRYAALFNTTYTYILDGKENPIRNNLSDEAIALTDVIKDILQILLHTGLVSANSLNQTFTYQLEHYKDKGLPNALVLMNELRNFVLGAPKESEKDIIQRLLKIPPQ